MERLSGDQNGKIAPVVSGNIRASSVSTGRTQSMILPSGPVAVNATLDPSGAKTGGPAKSPLKFSVVFSGGLITVRIDCAGRFGCNKKIPATAPSTSAANTPAVQRSLPERVEEEATAVDAADAAGFSVAIHCNCNFTSCAV